MGYIEILRSYIRIHGGSLLDPVTQRASIEQFTEESQRKIILTPSIECRRLVVIPMVTHPLESMDELRGIPGESMEESQETQWASIEES